MSDNNTKIPTQIKNIMALGHRVQGKEIYTPSLLETVPRSLNRDTLDIKIPFYGYDLWHLYELSYLLDNGCPKTACGEIFVPAESKYITESKSLKLYLNSFNMTKLNNLAEMQKTIQKDLSERTESNVTVNLYPGSACNALVPAGISSIDLDELTPAASVYEVNPDLLKQDKGEIITETLSTSILRSNCLITGQPDWGTVYITYTGRPINHEALLLYIISYRKHHEFHEHCVERIFTDIMNNLDVSELDIQAFYTRRGGIDISPRRSSVKKEPVSLRLQRQ